MKTLNESMLEVTKLVEQWNSISTNVSNADKALSELEQIFEDYLNTHPKDVKIWVMLALAVNTIPFADHLKAIACLEKALECEPNNIIALLLLVHINHVYCGIDATLLKRLEAAQSEDCNLQSLIEYAKALYYDAHNNDEMCKKVLLKSTSLCNQYVWNYIMLAHIYLSEGEICQGIELAGKGLKNIKDIYRKSDFINFVNPQNYIDEFFRGNTITSPTLEYVINGIVEKICQSLPSDER